MQEEVQEVVQVQEEHLEDAAYDKGAEDGDQAADGGGVEGVKAGNAPCGEERVEEEEEDNAEGVGGVEEVPAEGEEEGGDEEQPGGWWGVW